MLLFCEFREIGVVVNSLVTTDLTVSCSAQGKQTTKFSLPPRRKISLTPLLKVSPLSVSFVDFLDFLRMKNIRESVTIRTKKAKPLTTPRAITRFISVPVVIISMDFNEEDPSIAKTK